MTENNQELHQQQHFDAKLRSVKDIKQCFKNLLQPQIKTYNSVKQKIPYPKIVRLRSRKRLHQQLCKAMKLVPYMLYSKKKKSVSEILYKNLLNNSLV